ncbi:hypothetical protein GCM10020331_040190 [Ectobacillus funiculus]
MDYFFMQQAQMEYREAGTVQFIDKKTNDERSERVSRYLYAGRDTVNSKGKWQWKRNFITKCKDCVFTSNPQISL